MSWVADGQDENESQLEKIGPFFKFSAMSKTLNMFFFQFLVRFN